jgi:hypothetical protein
MGEEAACTAWFQGQRSAGKARLEHDALVFRGDFRLKVPLAEIRSVKAREGQLTVRFDNNEARFDLGRLAAKWERNITSPKSVLRKLGIRPGLTVVALGFSNHPFVKQLTQQTGGPVYTRTPADADMIFLLAERRADLEKLRALERCLAPSGAIWVIRPKGRPEITEDDVLSTGKSAGLVDVKVVSFSDTHTAEKFVIPVARRSARAARSRPRGPAARA